jgi:hypothetical protein
MTNERITIETFQDWKAVEDRNYRNEDKTMWSSSYDLVYKDILIASYGKRKSVLEELEKIGLQEMSEIITIAFEKSLINELRDKQAVQFVYGENFYDIFESIEGGYIYNVYPNEPDLIFDDDGELIDEEQLDGGLCSGNEIDVFTFIFPSKNERIMVVDSIEITANKTIEILSNGMACYNYKGVSYRLFESRENAIKYIDIEDDSLVVAEFSNDNDLDEYLEKLIMES